MFKISTIALAGLAIGLSATAADAAVIYYQDFTSTSTDALDGTSPTVNNSGTAVEWQADGALLDGTMAQGKSNWLPFSFGREIYEFEVKVKIEGSSSSSDWFAIGFKANEDPGDFRTGRHFGFGQSDQVNAHYWLLQRRNGGWAAFHGPHTTGPSAAGTAGLAPSSSTITTMKIVFDNTDADNRTIAMYLNGEQIDLDESPDSSTWTVSTIPVGIGFSKSASFHADIESLTLSVVPEPATMLLAPMAGLLFLRRRRLP